MGETTGMIVVVAEEAMIEAATGAAEGPWRLPRAGVVGTEAALALARWIPG